jgi:hypothetical protein
VESKVVYFEERTPENTATTFRLVRERLQGRGITKLVLASTTGATAQQALEFFADDGCQLIVVPHQWDFHRETNPFPQELVQTLRQAGHEVHFATMLWHTDSLYESQVPILMANLLRCFSQGVKVCFEIVLMVTDAGLVKSGERVIAIAGTGRGSDTALVMQAASSQHLKNLRVNEILCKPLGPINIDELRAAWQATETGAGEQAGR